MPQGEQAKAEPILQPCISLGCAGAGRAAGITWQGLFQTLASFAKFPELCPGAGSKCAMARAAGRAEPGRAAPGKAGELSQPAPICPWIFPGPGLGQRVCPKVVFLSHKFISVFELLCLVRNN